MELFANFWDGLFWFLVLLTPLVFVHELGHYLVARWCGVRVDVFSIGFGPELFGWNAKSGTRWKVCAIPLGGYIKMFGENTLEPGETGEVRELTPEEKSVSFEHKRLSQRAAVVFAGPAANYVFAILVLAFLYMTFGQSYTPAVIAAVAPDSAAARAGIEPGDRVVSIDGSPLERYEDLAGRVALHPGDPMSIEIERSGRTMQLTVTPDPVEMKMIDDTIQTIGSLGVGLVTPVVAEVIADSAAEEAGFRVGDRILQIGDTPIGRFEDLRTIVLASPGSALQFVILRDGVELILPVTPKPVVVETESGETQTVGQLGVAAEAPPTAIVRHGPTMALWQATKRSAEITEGTLTGLAQIAIGARDSKEMGGPIMIAQVSRKIAKRGVVEFIGMMVLFSITLGLINLFPIPVLDGGHLAFYALEAIRGRPLGERAQEYGFKIGLALVVSLMIFVMVNDLLHRVL
ncbi:MAG: RIP metalloprotease RseP [Alphaproteobacteria bacterium]|nr:RIP metalloprotease RseP [Alphaproteobacteria bacterium]